MTDSERITRLEERLAHLQQHVVAQDKAMLELHEALAAALREIAVLRGRLGAAPAGAPGEDERPPHY